MLNNLNLALAGHNEYRYQVAEKMGRHASWLSLVVRGSVKVKAEDQAKLAKILGRPVDVLFPETVEVAS